jgi:hypothetical protein
VLYILVPEIVLQRAGIVAVIGQLEAAGMSQHVRMDGKRQLGVHRAHYIGLAPASLIEALYCFHQNDDGSKCEVVHTSPPDSVSTIRLATLASLGGVSMRGEIINEYQKLNSKDQKAFHRWLWANAVVGAILLTGLIAVALQGANQGLPLSTMHTQAKLP